ncbi:MAG TPA: NAD(P)-dependent oxidoreductase [Terrimicrobiaceae bacterium]|nr:NAD(P)-dependent oxidoreductase [Terrimicrobiaceae bacterium]
MPRTVRQNAGVIGLGIIGSRVAANLRKAGFQTWVWNRTPRPEPNFLSSASEVAESAKIIQIFVSDGPALIETIEAMAPAIGPEHIVLNHATIAPKETLEAARMIHDRHARYLDAPFTGSRDAAEAAQIVFFIGGEAEVLERARPQLEVNAKAILPIGDIGQAAAMKIATNLIVAASVGSFAEAMALLETNGVPLYKLGEALGNHVAHSSLADLKVPAMIVGDFDPRFSLKHMFKDVQIALEMAHEHGVELPQAAAFAGSAMSGLQKGWGELDFSSIAQHYGYPSQENSLPDDVFASKAKPGENGTNAPRRERKRRFLFFGSRQ